jgi:UDP-N-acetylglucosamine--dolichyl-phosphate N-acetylglucosaminephosphotransferase
MDPTNGVVLEATNLTILNFLLLRLGPMNEKKLVQVLICTQVCRFSISPFTKLLKLAPPSRILSSQIAGSVLAFIIRYGLAGLVYDGDRR